MNFAKLLALPLGIALLTASLQAQTVTTVISNGTTETRYDIVILGDGYQASEQNQFNQDVTAFLTSLFQRAPYNLFANYYNVHTVFRASVDSGADRPDESPPIMVNTAYEATYDYGGTARCLYIQNTGQALADAALAPATEGRVLVMVNDDRYGGCASTFAVSYNGSSMTEVQAHELGHSLGQLADEYAYNGSTYTGSEPGSPNLTTSPTGQKWSIWHGTDGISSFQGGGYNQYGLWRPRSDCLMRNLGQALCRVCQESIVKITNAIANVMTSTLPANTSITVTYPNLQTFSFTHYVPASNSPVIEWDLDGVLQVGANTTNFTIDSTQLSLGSHQVTARIIDNTDRVRTDPAELMREEHVWQVQISDPSLAQLRIPNFTVSMVLVNPGSTVTLSPTIVNDGPAASVPFSVEFFLSSSPATYTTQDTYLGKIDIGSLSNGQQTNGLQLNTQLPWSMPLNVKFVHAVVDRQNVVIESNEADNLLVRALFAQVGPCTTGLEFQDPLMTPFKASMSLAAGGTVHPTVVAPCADPATTLYLIAWTGSGTSPGTPLGSGLTLPLNSDSLTQEGLNGLNGPIFGGFLGILNAQGVGQAQFTLPPSTAIPTGTTHFATVLLGTTQLFTAVSNPIELTILP
ncbi:MAG: hypothetical protein ACI9SE_000249 [Neolewinella sp.]|jgi:hypothetical protein